MSAARTGGRTTARSGKGGLDAIDTGLLRGLTVDGRRSASDLARELGISRAYANRKLQALLGIRRIRIRAFSSPTALGFRAGAMTSFQVSPGGMEAAVGCLRSLPEVCLLMITAGRQDLVAFTMFPTAGDLSTFLTEELGQTPGIRSTETLMIGDWRVRSVLSDPGVGFYSYLSSQPESRNGPHGGPRAAGSSPAGAPHSAAVDPLDLEILRAIERDPRQPISVLAKSVGTSQKSASGRLRSLLAGDALRIGVYFSPFEIGLDFFPIIGMKVSPAEVEAVAARVESLPNVFWMVRLSGRYDLLVGTMFAGPRDVARFVWNDLAGIPGILSIETSIGLEISKWSLPYMAGAYLDCLARARSG